ncbi:hypothetical protein CRUP_001847, partial [Coryphaenoides rupestris]
EQATPGPVEQVEREQQQQQQQQQQQAKRRGKPAGRGPRQRPCGHATKSPVYNNTTCGGGAGGDGSAPARPERCRADTPASPGSRSLERPLVCRGQQRSRHRNAGRGFLLGAEAVVQGPGHKRYAASVERGGAEAGLRGHGPRPPEQRRPPDTGHGGPAPAGHPGLTGRRDSGGRGGGGPLDGGGGLLVPSHGGGPDAVRPPARSGRILLLRRRDSKRRMTQETEWQKRLISHYIERQKF